MSDFRTRDTAPDARPDDGAYQAFTEAQPHARGARWQAPAGEEAERMEELLRTLCELPGPTGQEEAVTNWVAEQWEGRGEVTRTAVGNLFLHIPGPGPRVLLAAHADELSLIVRSITPEGFLRVLPGERDVFSFPYFMGQRFRILADGGELPGILATTTGHALTPEQRDRTRLAWDDLFIDVGMTAEEAAEHGIHVGTRMVWDPGIQRVGRLLVGKAMDDRLGVAVLVELSRRLAEKKPRFDITLALTVQEEIGMVGASSLARDGRSYDVGFIIDNGLAGDIPTVAEAHMPVQLGGGPALVHRDSSVHYSRRLIAELRAVAKKHEIPVQDVVLYHYSSDGAYLVRQGMETLLVAPPIRYSHSPFEAVDPRDVESAVQLFAAYLTESDPE
jgi:putative aminopeptidase FrvX